MLRNYLLVALRGLRRNRSASIINILGLSIGLACFILITVYVANERSYDRFHTHAKDIYRFTTIDEALGVSSNNVAITNPRMPVAAMEELPEIVNATRMLPAGRTRIEHGEDVQYSEETKYVEKNFFEIFDFEVSPGSYLEDFHQPRKMIMTSTMAQNTFGTTDVVGEVVTIDDEDWEVIGVMQDVEENSHLRFDVFHQALQPVGRNIQGI
jgi:putative ABC transport system permease protein